MDREKPMTVQELIDELQNVKDKTQYVNVYNSEGDLTANVHLFHEKWCIILNGGKPFYKIYSESK